MITSFQDLKRRLTGKPLRLAVVAAAEEAVWSAVREAARAGWIQPLLITVKDQESVPPGDWGPAWPDCRETATFQEAAGLGADLLQRGEADLIMKGAIPSADFLRPLLAKERDLLVPGKLLSHVGAFALPGKDRLTLLSDAGLAVLPDLRAKETILENAAAVARALGYRPPKVAVLSALEVVNPKIPSSVEADALKQLGREGRFGDALVSGPLALDNALCPDAVATKGLTADPVAGAADVLLLPELVSGNILFKSFSLIAGYPAAGVVVGARMPVIMTSRADKPETKLNSIALARYLAEWGENS